MVSFFNFYFLTLIAAGVTKWVQLESTLTCSKEKTFAHNRSPADRGHTSAECFIIVHRVLSFMQS